LRYFAAIAEAGTMTRAAVNLRMAQPALSRQMHELERELGVALLDRHPRGVAPTIAGEMLARSATQLIADIGAALDRADAAATGRRGRVTVAMPRVALVRGTADALANALRDRHPEIALIVREVDPVQAWEQVASGEVDVGFGAYPAKQASVHAEPLWEETITRAVIPASHPLAGRARITADELGGLPLIVAPRGIPLRIFDTAIAQLNAVGLRSPLLTVDTGFGGAWLMVAAGRGWFIGSGTLAQIPPEGTAIVAVDGLHVPIVGALGWRKTERRPVVRTVIEMAIDFARSVPNSLVSAEPVLPPAASRTARRREPGTMPIELELRHLHALLEVAAAQSLGRAAERLGLTQPALSRQIKELERSAGFSLLVRSPRGVALTAGGTALASECPALLGAVERLKREATRARRGMEGRCVIGAVTTLAATELLGNVLTQCAVKHPHIEIVVEEIPTPKQFTALRQGKIDVGLVHTTPPGDGPEQFRREQVRADRIDGALLSPTHPLAMRGEITAAELADVPFLFMERAFNPPFYDLVMSSLRAIGLKPLVEATYDGLPTVWSIAGQGRGWCLGFRSQYKKPPSGTVAVRITGFDVPWGLDVMWRKEERSSVVRAVVEAFRAK
jgi:DNA-binding transcriptional LysR family regulator